jgi:hypothetical protein
VDDLLPEPLPGKDAREVVRATRDLAPIVESVLLVMFPASTLYRTGDEPVGLLLEPAPDRAGLARLKDKLVELAARPEWRRRHAVAREVSDASGTRLEVLTPLAPEDYAGGPRLVGPFATEEEADAWGGDNAVSTLSYDTFFTGEAWLVDLFSLPEREPHGIE